MSERDAQATEEERDHARNRQLQRFLAREHEYQQMALDQCFSYAPATRGSAELVSTRRQVAPTRTE